MSRLSNSTATTEEYTSRRVPAAVYQELFETLLNIEAVDYFKTA